MLKGKKVCVLGTTKQTCKAHMVLSHVHAQSKEQEKARIAAVSAGSLVSGLASLSVLLQCRLESEGRARPCCPYSCGRAAGEGLRALHGLLGLDPRPVLSPVALSSCILTFELLGQSPV